VVADFVGTSFRWSAVLTTLTLFVNLTFCTWSNIRTMQSERKIIRLVLNRYLGRNIYFVTFCTHGRRPVFGDSERASWIIQTLRTVSESSGFRVHSYCVMPDHVHAVIEGSAGDSDLGRFVKAFKQSTAFHYKKELGESLWQRRYYEHILRPSDSLDAIIWYVWMNPVRAGLCAEPKSYPHSGSFTSDWGSVPRSEIGWIPPWSRIAEGGKRTT
jgi:putative transposase